MRFLSVLLSALAPVALANVVQNHSGQKKGLPILQHDLSSFGKSSAAHTEVVVIWVNHGGGATPVYLNEQIPPPPPVKGNAPVAPATHEVTVGGPQGLIFSPDTIQARIGDTVLFNFLAENHTATQSTFETPCSPLAGGMDTGFQPNPDNSVNPPPQVAMQVMVDTPLWFYCAQGAHCGKGMTFSVNPTADRTQAMFQAMAIQQNGNGETSPITGGEGDAPPPLSPLPPEEDDTTDIPDPSSDVPDSTTPETLPPLPPLSPPDSEVVPEQPATGGDDNIIGGIGNVLPDGSCSCAVAVGAGAFPAVGQQGVGNFGGTPGSLPVEMAAVI